MLLLPKRRGDKLARAHRLGLVRTEFALATETEELKNGPNSGSVLPYASTLSGAARRTRSEKQDKARAAKLS
jgi:hypothetical protein